MERSLISAMAMVTIGATFGALTNPCFVEKWGRIPDLILVSLVFIVGAVICALASEIAVMYVGRFITGFGIGMYALCVPVYIAACSPVNYRGVLTTLWQFGVTFGMLLGQGANIGLQHLSWGW